jgi:hypothetical protein
MLAMLEGVPLFGNPFVNEFVVGLSDAIPVFVISVLLSTLQTSKGERNPSAAFSLGQTIKAVSIFTGIFFAGRYIGYYSGIIQSGIQARPLSTLIWTILMGLFIGVVFVLLGNNNIGRSLKHGAVRFGLFVFGLNWAVFLLFMPLLFNGYITDAVLRIIIDVTLVIIASYFTILPKGKIIEKNNAS